MTRTTHAAPSRRNFLSLLGAMGAAATVVGTVAACGSSVDGGGNGTTAPGEGTGDGAGEPAADGTIQAAISYELGTNGFDPMSTSAALTVAANWHTMEGLTELLPSGDRDVYAALGADLPSQVDDLTYEVTLRDGAVFHDGTPVTTEDVVFSFERVLDPENASLYAGFVTFIESVEAKDEQTVTINLKHPFGLVAERISVVKIVPKAAVEADRDAFDANPIGTGAYAMTDNSAASGQIVFERNDDYTGPRPALAKTMTWLVTPDATTRTNALTSQQVQAIDSVPYLSLEVVGASATTESVQGFGLLFAMFNNGQAPFDDVRNRQAFLYAIDMDKVIQTAFLGNASAAKSFLQETHPDFQEASTVYSLDLDKATSLFAETGLTEFRMLCTDHDWVKLATPVIKESLEAAGVTVNFEEKQSADVYNTIDTDSSAYDVVVAPGDPSVFGGDPDLLMRWWFSPDVWTDQRMHWKGTDSYTQVQELLDEAVQLEGEERSAVWKQTFDLLSDEVPLYPLFHRKSPSAWDDSSLVGFQPISLTGLSFVDVASTN